MMGFTVFEFLFSDALLQKPSQLRTEVTLLWTTSVSLIFWPFIRFVDSNTGSIFSEPRFRKYMVVCK